LTVGHQEFGYVVIDTALFIRTVLLHRRMPTTSVVWFRGWCSCTCTLVTSRCCWHAVGCRSFCLRWLSSLLWQPLPACLASVFIHI